MAVVVATRNRKDRALRMLAALAAQRGAPAFELVMVDDASTDGTSEALQSRAGTLPFPFLLIRLATRSGPGEARNAGWRVASAPFVAFTDDDCVPDAGWLAALTTAIASADVVQGATHADPALIDRAGPWTEKIHLPHGTPFFETCNVAYRRQLLERLGGFDPRFRYAGEDVDLGQRALATGARPAFVADAVVIHDVVPWSLRDRFRHITERLGDTAQTVARYPGLRSILYHRLWYRRPHEGAVLAAVGFVAAAASRRQSALTRLAVAVLAAIPYLRVRLTSERLDPSPARNLALVPVALVVDLSEVTVLARGSLRYRTLVL